MVEAWSDFYSIYSHELTLLAQGSLSYRGTFTYTPLFLYTLYLFFRIGGSTFASIPILLSDAASASLIYLNARTITREKVAFSAGLCYALSPFMLIVEGYLWLSSQPMFLFMMLAMYFFREDKPLLSSFSIGLAIMFKQEAVFILPVYIACYAKKYKGKIVKGSAVLLTTLIIISLPFLLTTPLAYISSVSYGLLFKSSSAAVTSVATHSSKASLFGDEIFSSGTGCSLISSEEANFVSTCPFGIVTYSALKIGSIQVSLIIGMLQWASISVGIPIFLLIGMIFFFSRKQVHMLELGCAYSSVGFLLIFSYLVHGLWAYYFLPLYGLLLSSSRNFSMLLVVSGINVVSLFFPDGQVQAILAMLAILGAIMTSLNNCENKPMK